MNRNCNGSYAQVDRERDSFVRNGGSGAWGTATCPVCECRAPVMRPTRRIPQLNFGSHRISARAQARRNAD